MQAKIDQNDVKTWLAYNETTGLVENVLIDPVLDALLVYGVTSTGGTFTELNVAKIDENDVKTKLAYNENTGLVEALRCGNGGELLITAV